jgi:hypothetical protein
VKANNKLAVNYNVLCDIQKLEKLNASIELIQGQQAMGEVIEQLVDAVHRCIDCQST